MRLNHRSNKKVGSIGTRGEFTSSEKAPEKDTRSTKPKGYKNRLISICPECRALVMTKKAIREESGVNGRVPGINFGDPIIGMHRVGGGSYSIRRGDLLCKGVGLPISEKED